MAQAASKLQLNPNETLLQLFNVYNQKFFDGKICPSRGFRLRYSRVERLAGYFSYCLKTYQDWGIVIARRLQDHPRALRSTLVHEMIHMLAYQRYRETGNDLFLDRQSVEEQRFINKGHGAFFLSEMARLNTTYRELGLTVYSQFGDKLYDDSKIAPVRLLLVRFGQLLQKGMIYRLHADAVLDWQTLRFTARKLHESQAIELLQVAGQRAEGFPSLRKDNQPRVNMKRLSLRHFAQTRIELLQAHGSMSLQEPMSLMNDPCYHFALRWVS